MKVSLSDPHAAEQLKAQTALMQVIDPELFVNIIDLGLVYRVDFREDDKIVVRMTLSTPHCRLGDAIQGGVRNVLENNFPGREIIINLVWEPVWSFDMNSASGKEQLGWS